MSRSKRAFSRIMHEKRFTFDELADAAKTTKAKCYEVGQLARTTNFKIEESERVGDFFCENGEFRYSRAWLHDSCGLYLLSFGQPDGKIDDENADLTQAMGALITESRNSKDPRRLEQIELELEDIFARIRSEIALMKSRTA